MNNLTIQKIKWYKKAEERESIEFQEFLNRYNIPPDKDVDEAIQYEEYLMDKYSTPEYGELLEKLSDFENAKLEILQDLP